jgi:hypothetical protein
LGIHSNSSLLAFFMGVFCKLYSFFKPEGKFSSKSVPITLVFNGFNEFRILSVLVVVNGNAEWISCF